MYQISSYKESIFLSWGHSICQFSLACHMCTFHHPPLPTTHWGLSSMIEWIPKQNGIKGTNKIMKKLIVLVLKYILLLFFLVVLKQALSSVSYCYSLGQLSRDNPKSTSLKTQKIYVDVNKNSTFRQLQFCDWFQREQLPYAIAFIFLQFFFISRECVQSLHSAVRAIINDNTNAWAWSHVFIQYHKTFSPNLCAMASWRT